MVLLSIAIAAAAATLSRSARAQESAVLAFAFSEGAGHMVADFSASGHVGVLVKGATWTSSGRFGHGLVLDGRNGGVQLPLSEALAWRSAFTIEAWIKPTTDTGARFIAQFPGATGEGLLLNGNNHPRVIATFAGRSVSLVGPTPLVPEQWAHLAVTYDGLQVRLYLDAREVAAEGAPGGLGYSVPEATWIGRSRTGRAFSGVLDEVRVYRRALGPAEVALDMATPVDPATPFQITRVTPAPGVVGVLSTPVTATFSAPVNPGTVTASTVIVMDAGQTPVPATVAYDAPHRRAVLTPLEPWTPSSAFTVRVMGAGSGVASVDGSLLASDMEWIFRTPATEAVPSAAFAFGDADGLLALDATGNGHDGALVEGPAWTPDGYTGPGLIFDGNASGVRLPDTDALALSGPFTIEAWVKPVDASGARYVVHVPGASGDGLRLNGNGRARFAATFGDTPTVVTAPVAVPPGLWTHLAVTYDGHDVRLHVNGAPVASAPATGGLALGEPRTVWIGRSGNGNAFAGTIDEVRLYRRALTTAEIWLDMTAPVDEAATPLAIVARDPEPGARGVLAPAIAVTFNKALAPGSVTAAAFHVSDTGGQVLSATVAYDAMQRVVTIWPLDMMAGGTYRVEVAGGPDGVRDLGGGSLAADVAWTLTRAFDDTVPSAAYAFDEGAGNLTADLSGNGNTGILVEGAAWTATGRSGHGLVFDGERSGVQLPLSDTLRLASAFTLEAWVMPSASSGARYVVQMPGAVNEGLRLNGNGRPRFGASFTSGSGIVVSRTALPHATWSHLAVTYDGLDLRLHVNGLLAATRPVAGELAAEDVGAMWLGRARAGRAFAGVLDDIRIYRRALSVAEIVTDMNTPVATAVRQPTIAVNGILPPGVVTSTPGSPIAVRVDDGPGHATDWVALAPVDAPDTVYVERQYLNGGSTPPAEGIAATTLTFALPPSAGTFELRLYEAGSWTRVATSVPVVSRLPCTFAIDPPALSAGHEGIEAWLTLRTQRECSWTVPIQDTWLHATQIAGYAGAVLIDEPTGYWRLGSADAALDSTGFGGDGEYVGPVSEPVAGATSDGNGARAFAGGFLTMDDRSALDATGSFTIEAWIQSSDAAGGTVAGKMTGGSGYALGLSSGRIRFRTGRIEIPIFDLVGRGIVNDGEWHHIAAVYDDEEREARLYLDGLLDVASVNFDDHQAHSRGAAFVIGAESGGHNALLASIDEVAWFDAALSAEQMARRYESRFADPRSGSGRIVATIESNSGLAARATTIEAGGLAVPVAQAGRPCTSVEATAVSAGRGGGAGEVDVLALDSQCAWAAVSDAPWLSVTAEGVGSGAAQYTVAPNLTPFARRGTLTVAGSTVTVDQEGGAVVRPGLRFSVAVGSAQGSPHMIALKDDGTVWSWGSNTSGKLGDGSQVQRLTPVAVTALNNVVAVAAGTDHSLALKSDGTVWGWGFNGFGQLGDGTTIGRPTPVKAGLTDVVAIAAGNDHSVALRSDGTIWAWGRNGFGQLGDGTLTTRLVPTNVASLSGTVAGISARDNRTTVIRTDGTVWSVGRQWVAGTAMTFTSPTQLTGITSPIVAVGSGDAHELYLQADGAVWGAGSNLSGQVGDGTTSPIGAPVRVPAVASVEVVAGGNSHSVAASAGVVWTWGANGAGQLGDGSTSNRATPHVVSGPADVIAVAAGWNSSVAVSGDGRVWTWGSNETGQLGDGTLGGQRIPRQISDAGFAWWTPSPRFTVAEGTYTATRTVGMISALTGVTIRYTTNGSDPTELDATLAVGASVVIDATATLKARSWLPGRAPSNVTSAAYVLRPLMPSISPGPATYTSARTVTMSSSTVGTSIFYTLDDSIPTTASAPYTGPIVVDTGRTVSAIAAKPGWTDSDVRKVTYVMNFGTLSAPALVPAPGQYEYGQAVTMSALPEAAIRYSFDGTAPTASSPEYDGPLALEGARTVTARAFHADWTPSPSTSAAYSVRVNTPSATPAGGIHPAAQAITVADATPGADVRYTTNGLDPTLTDPAISNGGTIGSGNFTLKLRAFRPDLVPSDVAAFEYRTAGETCTYALDRSRVAVGARPGGGVVAVSTSAAECAWQVMVSVPWITTSVAAGTGDGRIVLWVERNDSVEPRTAVVWLGNQHLTVTQAGQPICDVSVNTRRIAVPEGGQAGALDVLASDEACAWDLSSDMAWVSFVSPGTPGPYAKAVLDDGPAGYWRLDDPAGSTDARDTSSGGLSGAYLGAVVPAMPGALGDHTNGAWFGDVEASVEIPHHEAFELRALSWEVWVNVDAVSSERRPILGKGSLGAESFAVFIAPGASEPSVAWTTSTAGRHEVTLPHEVVGQGWTHLAFTYGGASWRAYVNGFAAAAGTAPDDLAFNAGPIRLGGAGYEGGIDEVAVYGYALSPEQIADHVARRAGMALGSAELAYVAEPNPTLIRRDGTFAVNDITVAIVQAGGTDMVIAPVISPQPRASGWHASDVQVSFVCFGTGTVYCPDPVDVTEDGVHEISGTALNDLWQVASTTATVRVDRGAPVVSVASPTAGALVEPGRIAVRGGVFDRWSAVHVVCNGAVARVVGTSFSCDPTVFSGISTIHVVASDGGGNVSRADVSVTTSDVSPVAPSRLRVTPQNASVRTNTTRRFRVLDDRGRSPQSAAWSIDDLSRATLAVVDGEAEVTGVSAGEVLLSASWRGLTATTQVRVSGDAMVVGSVLWTAPAAEAASVEHIAHGAVTLDGRRHIYAVEHDDASDRDLLRAFDVDGREQWATRLEGHVVQLSGDPLGGVMAALDDYSVTAYTAGGAGSSLGPITSQLGFAIDPDGTLYVTNGGLRFGSVIVPFPQADDPGGQVFGGIPTVLEDGRVAVPLLVKNTGPSPDRVLLFLYTPGGAAKTLPVWKSVQPSWNPAGWNRNDVPLVWLYKAVPNGRGQFMVAWNAMGRTGDTYPYRAYLATVSEDGTMLGAGLAGGTWGNGVTHPWGAIVVGEDRVITTAYRLCPQGSCYLDPHNRAVLSQYTLNGALFASDYERVPANEIPKLPTVSAVADGFVVSWPDGTIGGADATFDQMSLVKAQYLGDQEWIGSSVQGSLTSQMGPAVGEANSVWPTAKGPATANAAERPGRGILLKGHALFGDVYRHASIRVAPRNIEEWRDRRPDLFVSSDSEGNDVQHKDRFGNSFFTIGAGPDGKHDISLQCVIYPHQRVAILTSDINRAADVYEPPIDIAGAYYNRFIEDRLIEELLRLDEAYQDNLDYACLPFVEGLGYNSNSFAAGLLNAARVAPPSFPLLRRNMFPCGGATPVDCESYAGWTKPVPAENFGLSNNAH